MHWHAGLFPKIRSTSSFTAHSPTISAHATCSQSAARACYNTSRRYASVLDHGPTGNRDEGGSTCSYIGAWLQIWTLFISAQPLFTSHTITGQDRPLTYTPSIGPLALHSAVCFRAAYLTILIQYCHFCVIRTRTVHNTCVHKRTPKKVDFSATYSNQKLRDRVVGKPVQKR